MQTSAKQDFAREKVTKRNKQQMNNTTTSSSSAGGVGFFGLLTIVFITLKLCGVIAWSWWWVLSPLWIGFAIFMAILIVFGIIAIIVAVATKL